MTSQIRRASTSIPANIAEGRGRQLTRDLLHHLSIAHGSPSEIETQVLIARRLAYLSEPTVQGLPRLTAEVGRLIGGISDSLARRQPTSSSAR